MLGDPCKVEGCMGRNRSKGFCNKHYWRNKRHGVTTGFIPVMCNVEGCEIASYSLGMCRKHYKRFTIHGDTCDRLMGRIPKIIAVEDRYTGIFKCAMDDCYKKRVARGLCTTHYQQLRRRDFDK